MSLFLYIPRSHLSIQRKQALDALRGFAIILMVFVMLIPPATLSHWLNLTEKASPISTIKPLLPESFWIDWVFALFLFALGVAIPLSQGKRMEEGQSFKKSLATIIKRTFLLVFFALYLQHIRPYILNPEPVRNDWLLAIIGFILMFFIFTRLPQFMNIWFVRIIRGVGWVGSAVLLWRLRYLDGSGFSLQRMDPFLLILANMAFWGSLIWLFTYRRFLLRLGILGLLIAFRFASLQTSALRWFWHASPCPWLFKWAYLQYLLIVIPGIIAGELLLKWIEPRDLKPIKATQWSRSRMVFLSLILLSILGLTLFYYPDQISRNVVYGLGILTILGLLTMKRPTSDTEQLLKMLFYWAIYWFIAGLMINPFKEKHDMEVPSLSFLFIVTALSTILLIFLIIIIDKYKKNRWFSLLIDCGQNSMIAYAGFMNFIWPILVLSGLQGWLSNFSITPLTGLLLGIGYTFIVAYFVKFFTRLRIFWKT